MKKIRWDWVDAIRAFAISLVVLGHQIPEQQFFFIFTSPVKMPLFFMLSGFLFNEREGDVVKFLKNITKRLIIPYFSLSLIAFIVKSIRDGFSDMNLTAEMLGILDGSTYWFIPCFVIAQTVFFLVLKLFKKTIIRLLCCLILAIGGLLASIHFSLRFCCIDVALTTQILFFTGHEIKRYFKYLKAKVSCLLACIVIYVISVFITLSCYGRSIDIHTGFYNNYLFDFITILAGCYSLFILAGRINHFPSFLTIVGKHTLVIYMWHGLLVSLFSRILKIMHINVVDSCFVLMASFFALTFGTILSMIMNKYLPWAIGAKNL